MSALERIEVRGFKSIRELDLELRSLNVLIGPNGVGKSNLIGVFELLYQVVQRNLQTYVEVAGGADTLLYFGRKQTEAIELSLAFLPGEPRLRNGYTCRLVPTADDKLIFDNEECWFHDRARYLRPYTTSLGTSHRETRLYEEVSNARYRTVAHHVLQAMCSWRVYHFHDTSKSSPIKRIGDIDDNAELRDDASNLAAFLYYLQQKQPESYRRIVGTVRLVAPFFDDFVLGPRRLNEDKIRLEWRERGSDAYFNAHALSDGTLRFMCLATLLLMPDPPSTILIDEPELGLHPYAITLLAGLLRSAAARTQVLVSTQSVTLVNQFAAEDVIVVDRQDGQSIFTRPDATALQSWLEDYGVGDLWEKNLLGGRPR